MASAWPLRTAIVLIFSSLTLGGVNSTYYSGSINYVPLSTPVATPNWIIPCEGISLNGAALGLKTTSALIDS